MRPTGLRAVVVLAATSLVVTGLTSSTASAAPGGAAAPAAAAAGGPARSDRVTERKNDLDKQIDDIRESLEGTSADLVDAAVALKRSEAGLVTVRAELAAAQAALAAAEKRDAELATELAVAREEEAKAVKALEAQAKAEAQTRAQLGRLAREAYSGSGMTGLSIALQADSPDQFAERMAVAGAVMRSENSEVDRLVVARSEMRARTAKLTALRARTAELKKLAAQVVEQRAAAQARAAAAEAEQTRLVDEQTTALGVIKDKQAQEKDRLAKAQAEQDQLEKILRARAEKARKEREARERRDRAKSGGGSRGGSSGGTSAGSGGSQTNRGGYLSYPVNARVTSGYGMRYHPILHYWRLHGGTDFGAACGTPLRAPADGTIVRAGWAGGFGNQIVVDHGYVRGVDLSSSMNHLSRIYVSSGRVRRGQVIGLTGTTGLSTGCHLHFEVYQNGSRVNPMRWL
ncbi:M23 family metallopeptidase [Kineosporia sp. R_H_3]|uniref:M23 family metallopeptidase n=1 Tax=Kineosporia sp. R_H_3 TaxID=1961848 RepID=UPI000B4A8326|nr:M23 family metallopeptidase [Kineosporia sp. R_H_3]